jgi:hypothetical protein
MLGFAAAHIKRLRAWTRMFTLGAIALLALVGLAKFLKSATPLPSTAVNHSSSFASPLSRSKRGTLWLMSAAL